MRRRFRALVVTVASAALGGAALAVPMVPASAAPTSDRQGEIVAALAQRPAATPDVPVGDFDSYVVLLKTDPVLGAFGRQDLDTPQARRAQQDVEEVHDEILQDAGVPTKAKTQDFTVTVNGFAAAVNHAAAQRIAEDPRVAIVVPDELRHATRDDRGTEAGADFPGSYRPWWWWGPRPGKPTHGTPTHGKVPTEEDFLDLTGRGEAYDAGITGEGVLVGVIDTGIWPEHPSFADDGTLPAAPALLGDSCDFGNTAGNPDDEPFTCNDKLVGARDMLVTYRQQVGAEDDEFESARDDDGHGTHTASTAAGNAGVRATISGQYFGKTSGIAHRAQIVAYKGLGNEGGFTSDLANSIDQAVQDGVDVINYSIGGGAGLVSADTIAFLFAADAGVFVATSAGNSGPAPETIGGPADVPWVTTVAASTQPRFYQGVVRLGNGVRVFGASVTPSLSRTRVVDGRALGNPQCLEDVPFSASVRGAIVLCERGGPSRVSTSLAVLEAGGVGEILMNIDTPEVDNLFTDNFWVPTVHVDQVVGEQVRSYIERAGRRAVASLSTGDIVKQPWRAPSITKFSSRGPNPSEASLIKPDITAPGMQVLAGASPFPDPEAPGGNLFQAISGTSMSSPQIAGFYGLLKQAHPEWSPAAAKSALQTTASQRVVKNDRVTPADPFDFGAGHVDAGRVNRPGLFDPGLVYDAGFEDYLGFLCDTDTSAFANPEATCAALDDAGVPTRAEDLNVATIGVQALAGEETVTRTVTNVSDRTLRMRPDIDAPDGYDVSVSPRRLTLRAGASATVEITFTADGTAPFGEWRFGNLTWEGSGYEVNSSLAVRGQAIAEPGLVEAEGASGTADIPVQFGYDGPYEPVPAGLVPSDPLTGSVGADPDQTYPSGDDDEGGVTEVPVTIGDTAYWRIEYAAPGDDDLDLYLLGPDGEIVAQSTAGGTNELIELTRPAPGTYTVVVHGWQVGSPPHEFSIDSWVVPTGPGSLVVDSAPATAEIGATGTVTVSWTGATGPGEWYGVVDHTDGSDTLAQTIVAVTGG